MRKRRFAFSSVLLALLAVTFPTACDTGFVENAARQSLSSFVIDIMSTAINETLTPDE